MTKIVPLLISLLLSSVALADAAPDPTPTPTPTPTPYPDGAPPQKASENTPGGVSTERLGNSDAKPKVSKDDKNSTEDMRNEEDEN